MIEIWKSFPASSSGPPVPQPLRTPNICVYTYVLAIVHFLKIPETC